LAIFGQKDAQQLILIRRMVADLDFPVEVVAAPTVRSEEGLALSSRNAYLGEIERAQAHALWAAIEAAQEAAGLGPEVAREAALAVLNDAEGLDVDYLALVDLLTLNEVEPDFRGEAILLIAAQVGSTRLIDNALLKLGTR
ncbi:MAG TPA: pantoate--beta-alanine ligase, partial [Actinomycetales bacterium]|nr:pantoate--beta-alanine ligase [Actinomycetales bacterium]